MMAIEPMLQVFLQLIQVYTIELKNWKVVSQALVGKKLPLYVELIDPCVIAVCLDIKKWWAKLKLLRGIFRSFNRLKYLESSFYVFFKLYRVFGKITDSFIKLFCSHCIFTKHPAEFLLIDLDFFNG